MNKTKLAKQHGFSRSSLYYKKKLPFRDWQLKIRIEEALHDEPSYGHKRLADYLGEGKSKIIRVMKMYGIKPYRRRRARKWKKAGKPSIIYPNLLLKVYPSRLNQIWASDFTRISYQGRVLYLVTIMDIFNREIIGFSVMLGHGVSLVINTFLSALSQRPPPEILHSDQGSEYTSKGYIDLVELFNIKISMSRKASPWENGYQESFYNQFKVDLGDPNRFDSLGEFIYAIYQQIHHYNNQRIHTALKTSPRNYLKSLKTAA